MNRLNDASSILSIVASIVAIVSIAIASQNSLGGPVTLPQGFGSVVLYVVGGIAAAFVIILLVLHLHYDNLKPALVVAVSPKEAYFKERITVHNRNDTAYSYKIRVGKTYLKWQSDIVSQGEKLIATLGPGNGSGVILDDVVYQLGDNDIVIESLNWRPWPFSKVAYRRRFKEI